MSDDVRDEFARSYPEGHIAVPPASDLWARGRKQRRRRRVIQAVGAAASIVVVAGVGAVYGLPEVMTSHPAPQVGSDGIQDKTLRAEDGAAQLVAAVEDHQPGKYGYLTHGSDTHGIATDLELSETTCAWLADEAAAQPDRPVDLVISEAVREATGEPLDSLGLAAMAACNLRGEGPMDQGRVPPFAGGQVEQPTEDQEEAASYADQLAEDLEEHSPITEPTEAERAEAQERQQANKKLHAELNQGLLQAPDGWEPAEAPPADLSGLGPRSGEGAWYVGLETETGLADRAMLDERIGADAVAELCGWLERESDQADEAAGEPVSRHTVAHHLLRTAGVTGGDGLSLVVAAACR